MVSSLNRTVGSGVWQIQGEFISSNARFGVGVTSQEVISSYLFETDNSYSVTSTGERYRDMIDNVLPPAVKNRSEVVSAR